jgi:serine/threonine protein kinase
MTESQFHKQHTQPVNGAKPTSNAPMPEKVGPYKIETLLHQGTVSWLYMGIDPETKRPIAVKILPESLMDSKESMELFLKKSILSTLPDHPNIVKVYAEGQWEGGLYIAMQWIHAISLQQFFTKQSLSLKRSLDIILQISYGLKHLHDHGIVHTDLKPENILITEEGMIKLIDFGIAQIVDGSPLFASTKILGTPIYMSPEQKENPNQLSYSSDIYSLGVLAYELILGKPSYGVINTSLLPEKLRKIISKALAISTKQRYSSLEPFIQDLTDYISSKEIEKEKPEQDESIELWEVFQKHSARLSPSPAPSWPHADIGIGKFKSNDKFGLYYDLFTLSQERQLLLIADTLQQDIDALFPICMIRGIIRSAISDSFDAKALIQTLQKQLLSDPILQPIGFSYLVLDPLQNSISFYNAGLSQLVYTQAGQRSKILYNANPLLSSGKESEIAEITETWNVGDVILYHNLTSEERDPPEHTQSVESYLQKILQEQLFLSAQSQADTLIEELSRSPFFPPNAQTKVLFSIQRLD